MPVHFFLHILHVHAHTLSAIISTAAATVSTLESMQEKAESHFVGWKQVQCNSGVQFPLCMWKRSFCQQSDLMLV